MMPWRPFIVKNIYKYKQSTIHYLKHTLELFTLFSVIYSSTNINITIKGVLSMKTNKLKKTILAVSLSAAIAIPTATSWGTAMTVHAASNLPFCADTDNNGAYNFQEDQISVSKSYYRARTNTISLDVTEGLNGRIREGSFYVVSNGEITNLQPLAKYVLRFNISGDNISESDINRITLSLRFKTGDKGSLQKIEPSMINEINKNTYAVSFDFIAYGESVSFNTNRFSDPTIKCSTAAITAPLDNEEFCMIEVKPTDGEKLFIRMKYIDDDNDGIDDNDKISWDKIETWAKRLCIYANSLNMTTDVQLDTLFMEFDYFECPYHAFSYNILINEDNDKYGYVAFNQYATKDVKQQIKSGNNSITWVELHEMAHSYGVKPSFADNYRFSDEYFTNARGITAIQNCDNLRGTDIVFETGGFSRKYDNMLHDIYTNDPKCELFGFASGLGFMSWEQLESFFAAESDNDPGFVVSRGVAQKINQFIGMNVPLSERYLKFANTIRKLMVLENNGVYDESKFTSFMREKFPKDLVRTIVTYQGLDQDKDYFN